MAAICGCDSPSDYSAPVSEVSNVSAFSKTNQPSVPVTPNVQRKESRLGFSWGDEIYDAPLFEGEPRTFFVNIEADCEAMQLHATATFQSTEVDTLHVPLTNDGPGRCRAELTMPSKLRPMWVQLSVGSEEGSEFDDPESACLYATIRNIGMLCVGDGSTTSMDTLSKYPAGAKLVNPVFVKTGCDIENYREYYVGQSRQNF